MAADDITTPASSDSARHASLFRPEAVSAHASPPRYRSVLFVASRRALRIQLGLVAAAAVVLALTLSRTTVTRHCTIDVVVLPQAEGASPRGAPTLAYGNGKGRTCAADTATLVDGTGRRTAVTVRADRSSDPKGTVRFELAGVDGAAVLAGGSPAAATLDFARSAQSLLRLVADAVLGRRG